MKKRFVYFFISLCALSALLLTQPIFAQDTTDTTDQKVLDDLISKNQEKGTAQGIIGATKSLFQQGGYQVDAASANLPARVGRVINIVFAVSGTLFLSIVIYSGIRWMTASGNEDEVKKSKKRITRASIGLLIMLASWILTSFVLRGLLLGQGSPNGRVDFQRSFSPDVAPLQGVSGSVSR